MRKVREMINSSWLLQLFKFDPISLIILIALEIAIVMMAGGSLYLMLVPDPLIN